MNYSVNGLKNNNINRFGSVAPANASVPVSTENKEKQKNKSDKLLYSALGGLALIAMAGISYKFLHKAPKDKATNILSNAAIPEISPSKYIEMLKTNIQKQGGHKFEQVFKNLNPSDYSLPNFLKNEDEKLLIKYLIAAKKTKIQNIPLPKVFAFKNVDSNKAGVSKIFANIFDSNFAKTKYTKGHMPEFIESLNEFSSKALKNYDENKTYTFLHFGNASEFLQDLNLKENELFKTKFDNIIDKNQENKIAYILDDKATAKLNNTSFLKLNFDEKINTTDLTDDLDKLEFDLGYKLNPKIENVNKELFKYIKSDEQSVFLIKNLLIDNPTEKVYIANSKDKNAVEKAIELISSKTDNVYEKMDCKETPNLASILTEKGEKAEELYNRAGNRTFLYLDNLESLEQPQIKDFIANASAKYHIIPVINSQKKETISTLNLPENQILKMKFWNKGQKAMVDSLELMQERALKNDFSHVDLEHLKLHFFNLIAAERSGNKDATAYIKNGILLHGSDKFTRVTADAIKNTVDANYVKLNYDKSDHQNLIIALVEEAEKAENSFKQTCKRTIIEADGLDDILTLNTAIRGNLLVINAFKNIAEYLSERYHTTLIMRTDKPLEKFEPASIASNRLGMHIEVK